MPVTAVMPLPYRLSDRSSVQPFVHLSIRLSVTETCKHYILKTKEQILMPVGTQGNGTKRSSVGVKRSKFKVTQGRR